MLVLTVHMDPRRSNPVSLRERILIMKERAQRGEFLSPEEVLLRFADLYEELLAIIDELEDRNRD